MSETAGSGNRLGSFLNWYGEVVCLPSFPPVRPAHPTCQLSIED